MKDGFDIHRRSSVRSFFVGLSMTCVRLWSFNISSKFWCRNGSCLLDTTDGMFQSMWPRLKSPLSHMVAFVLLHTLLKESFGCSNDSPLSEGGL